MEKFTAYDAYNIIKNRNFSNPQSVIEFIIDDIKKQALFNYKKTKAQFRESLRNGERVYLFANRFIVKDSNEIMETISEIQDNVFPVIEQLRKEAFFQNNINKIPSGRFQNPTECLNKVFFFVYRVPVNLRFPRTRFQTSSFTHFLMN